MIYKHLPPVGSKRLFLPELEHHLTAASSPRLGMRVNKVWVHRWGGGTFSGVERWFDNPTHQASAHVVYAGETGPFAGHCAQMVRWSRKAWTEAFFNRSGISIESADAIWLGRDPVGFARLARMTAYLLHHNGLPPRWISASFINLGKGFCRHADGGALAGGHTQCPTTDLQLWRQFDWRVKKEHAHGGFRHHWGIT
jgi:hypothetical protein